MGEEGRGTQTEEYKFNIPVTQLPYLKREYTMHSAVQLQSDSLWTMLFHTDTH